MVFAKGQTGNRGGFKGVHNLFSDALALLLHTAEKNGTLPPLPRGCTIAYLLAHKMVKNALECDNPETQLKYIRETLDRHIGKAIQPIAASLEVNVTLADRLTQAEKLTKAVVLDSVSVPIQAAITDKTDNSQSDTLDTCA
jgi:hypothetical protein